MAPKPPVARALVAWYRTHARELEFRNTRDPWRVLVAEVVLQQTRIDQAQGHLRRFLAKFPTPSDLAKATEDDVLLAWEGLGYYRRATNLRKAAIAIVERHGGQVPGTIEELVALPGVGPYTAGAVGSIAFGLRVPAVDGNAARVLSRLFMIEDVPETAAGRKALEAGAQGLHGRVAPGALNQAIMELGATVCTPRNPECEVCPVSEWCAALEAGAVAQLPARTEVPAVPEYEVAFGVVERAGRVLAIRRRHGVMMSGMWSLPGGEMKFGEQPEAAVRRYLKEWGVEAGRGAPIGEERKVFSSRVWNARLFKFEATKPGPQRQGALWLTNEELAKVPFVPFQRKILERHFEARGR